MSHLIDLVAELVGALGETLEHSGDTLELLADSDRSGLLDSDWLPNVEAGSDLVDYGVDMLEQAGLIAVGPSFSDVAVDAAVEITDTATDLVGNSVTVGDPALSVLAPPGTHLTYGDPIGALETFQAQQFDDTCAVVCQSGIIEDLTGVPVGEDALTQLAFDNGWYAPGAGTAPEHVGELLEAFDIPCDRSFGATLDDLKLWLADGREIIVGLDGQEIWNQESAQMTLNELIGYPDAGHAVRVTGVEEDVVTGAVSVLVNDPGQPGGAGFRVAGEAFLNAWDDMQRFACVTRGPVR